MLPLADQVDELQVHHDRLVLLAELDRCFHIHGAALIAIGRPGLLPAWPPAVVFPFARSPRRAAGPMTPGPGPGSSDRFFSALAGTDTNRLVDRADEDLAVTDAVGLGALLDGVDHLMDHLVGDDDLELYLRYEVHDVGRAAVNFFLTAGTTEAFDLGHGHALDTDFGQGILDLVQLERLDNRLDLLHLALHLFLGGYRPSRSLPSLSCGGTARIISPDVFDRRNRT